jgi:hypothetical protein
LFTVARRCRQQESYKIGQQIDNLFLFNQEIKSAGMFHQSCRGPGLLANPQKQIEAPAPVNSGTTVLINHKSLQRRPACYSVIFVENRFSGLKQSGTLPIFIMRNRGVSLFFNEHLPHLPEGSGAGVLLENAVRDFPWDRNEEYTGEARCDG